MKRLLLILLCVGLPTQAFAQGTPPVRVTDAGVGSPTDAAAGVDANGSAIAQLRQMVIDLAASTGHLASLVAGVDIDTIGGNAVVYDPCLDPSKVLVTNILATAASGSTELIAVSGSTRVYLCGWQLQGGAAGDITLNFGSGTTCGSNTKAIASTQVVNAGEGSLHPANKTFDRSVAARALCVNRSASMTLRGFVSTVQEADP
jgi:hypothetical protein